MVALTPRFAVLVAFVSSASLMFTPLPTGAVAIHKPSSLQARDAPTLPVPISSESEPSSAATDDSKNATQAENPNKARFVTWPVKELMRLAQIKSKRRHHQRGIILDASPLAYVGLGENPCEQEHFRHRRHAFKTEQEGETGTVEIISPDSTKPDGTILGYMVVDTSSHAVNIAERNGTKMELVDLPSTSRAQTAETNSRVPKLLQVNIQDESTKQCITYDYTGQELTATTCTFLQPGEPVDKTKGQVFYYDKATGSLEPPYNGQDDLADSSQAQGVLQRKDAATRNVKFMFIPDGPQAANVGETNATAVTSTMTTTLTVAGTPTASLAAAELDATSSASSSTGSVTSTFDASVPTASSAGVLSVDVVGSESESTAIVTSTQESLAAPSPTATTTSAEEVASSIAAANAVGTDAPSTVTASVSADTSSSIAAPSAAAVSNSAMMSSSTESSAVPSMTPLSTAPYRWVFRREY